MRTFSKVSCLALWFAWGCGGDDVGFGGAPAPWSDAGLDAATRGVMVDAMLDAQTNATVDSRVAQPEVDAAHSGVSTPSVDGGLRDGTDSIPTTKCTPGYRLYMVNYQSDTTLQTNYAEVVCGQALLVPSNAEVVFGLERDGKVIARKGGWTPRSPFPPFPTNGPDDLYVGEQEVIFSDEATAVRFTVDVTISNVAFRAFVAPRTFRLKSCAAAATGSCFDYGDLVLDGITLSDPEGRAVGNAILYWTNANGFTTSLGYELKPTYFHTSMVCPEMVDGHTVYTHASTVTAALEFSQIAGYAGGTPLVMLDENGNPINCTGDGSAYWRFE